MVTLSISNVALWKVSAITTQQTGKRNSVNLNLVMKMRKGFGLEASKGCVATIEIHKVKLVMPDGNMPEFDALNDQYIMEVVEEAGLELPYSYKVGACNTCVRQLKKGSVD
eukprot:Gb_03914 [translate_table: standard]